jgi:hypothetical protein
MIVAPNMLLATAVPAVVEAVAPDVKIPEIGASTTRITFENEI